MSWLFSQALMKDYENSRSSQELAAEYSVENCSGGEPSAQLSGNHIPLAYLSQGKMKEFSRLSRYGMTFKPLTESLGAELLTWYLEDSRAKIFPAEAKALASREADQVCGNTWRESSVKYDRNAHSWRTHLCLWDEALQWSSVTLPKWGMTLNGALFQHPTLERPISETGFGLWPTPTAAEGSKIPARANYGQIGLNNHPLIRGLPTRPKASKDRANFDGGMSIQQTYPTPVASEGADCGSKWSNLARLDKGGRIQRRMATMKTSETLTTEKAAINPMWVEWLMGWPLGWTDLKPLETGKFQLWLQQHSES